MDTVLFAACLIATLAAAGWAYARITRPGRRR